MSEMREEWRLVVTYPKRFADERNPAPRFDLTAESRVEVDEMLALLKPPSEAVVEASMRFVSDWQNVSLT